MAIDHNALRTEELRHISETLHELTDDQWDAASLCEGWRVRDVVSHMCLGYTMSMTRILGGVARYRGSVPAGSKAMSIEFGSTHSPAEILTTLDAVHEQGIRRGISRLIPAKEALVDHTIHHSDITRPLGLTHDVPVDRMRVTLDTAIGVGGFTGAKKRAAGLQLVATDVDWSWGSGPGVKGPAEAILLALGGRTVAFADLDGDGLDALRQRA